MYLESLGSGPSGFSNACVYPVRSGAQVRTTEEMSREFEIVGLFVDEAGGRMSRAVETGPRWESEVDQIQHIPTERARSSWCRVSECRAG